MTRRYYSSIAQRTTLSGSILSGATTIAVVAVTGFPATKPYTLILDQDTVNEEVVTVTASSGTTLTVTRGVDGTTGVAHSAGATVNHGVSARDFDEPNAFINGTGFVSPTLADAKGDLIVATADDTLARLAVGTNGHVVTADSGETGGMKWAQPGATPTQNTQTGTTYTAVLLDAGKTVTLSNASAVTLTIPAQASVSWADNTQLNFLNLGAGTVTITAAAGVTINGTPLTLATSKGGSLVRTASNVWTFIPFSAGVEAANFTNAATGTYTTGGFDYKYKDYTGTDSVTFDRAGEIDLLVIGGGGSGGRSQTGSANYAGGGGAGGLLESGTSIMRLIVPIGTFTITVGAGAAVDNNGNPSTFGLIAAVGGGKGSGLNSGLSAWVAGALGGSGGGGSEGNSSSFPGIPNQGFAGGTASSDAGGGGGGAGAAGINGAANVGGNGGAPKTSLLTGSSVSLAGGGAGHGQPTTGTASGGGGTSASANGVANTGGGGGAANTPGQGGSGLIRIRVVV